MTAMFNSTELDSFTTTRPAPQAATPARSAEVVRLQREPASNEPVPAPRAYRGEAEAWALHALSSNGFGDAAPFGAELVAPERQAAYDLYKAAGAHRAKMLGDLVTEAFRGAMALAREAHARYRRYRDAAATYEALHELDDRTLHDLGFERSELLSVATEMTGDAERTRLRVLQNDRG
jgi:uncharacterized protein YjiS (DUF1127 family)